MARNFLVGYAWTRMVTIEFNTAASATPPRNLQHKDITNKKHDIFRESEYTDFQPVNIQLHTQ